MYKMTEEQIVERTIYVAWRREWRAEYAELTRKIRVDKIACKEAQRAGYGSVQQENLSQIRKRAAQMMIERTEMDDGRRTPTQEVPAKAA